MTSMICYDGVGDDRENFLHCYVIYCGCVIWRANDSSNEMTQTSTLTVNEIRNEILICHHVD